MPLWASNFYWRAGTRSANISAYIRERCCCFDQVQDPAMRSAPSDEGVCDRWVAQARFGDKFEPLLADGLRVAHDAGALRRRDLKRVTVDTTVQPKPSPSRPTASCCMQPSKGSTGWSAE